MPLASLASPGRSLDDLVVQRFGDDWLLAERRRLEALVDSWNAQILATDAQLAKTGAKLDKLARMYGGVANNQGAVAEEFYFNSLKHNPVLRGIHFDSVYKNLTNNSHGIEDEYDILLLNGRDVFIIEVKYKARADDVTTLIQKKAANFRPLFPAYQDHTLHLGLASFHMDDEVKRSALSQGVTLLQRKGDFIETTPETPFH